jgi:hypothetical protein
MAYTTTPANCCDCGNALPIPRHGRRIRCFACSRSTYIPRKKFDFSVFESDWRAGISARLIAKKHSVNIATVYKAARTAGEVKRCGVGAGSAVRAEQMAQSYTAGLTLVQIGEIHGVTRERVRQIISAAGITGKDGGKSVSTAINRRRRGDAAKLRLENRCMSRLKCSADQIKAITGSHEVWTNRITRAYLTQSRNAEERGIDFLMPFPEWWAVWQASGKWSERGRGAYVMARNGDIGPYAIGNVRICTQSENSKESYLKTPGRVRAAKAAANPNNKRRLGCGRGWVLVPGLKAKPYQVHVRKKHVGMFATPDEAHAAYVAECERIKESERHEMAA